MKTPNKQYLRVLTLLDFEDRKISNLKPDQKLNVWSTDPTTRFKSYATEYFIIAEINLSSLKSVLNELKRSVWWNVYGLFFIQKINLNSCKQAYDYLKIAWSFNILSVIYTCMDPNSKVLSFTFNPYNKDASIMWTKHDTINQRNGHPFVLFRFDHADYNGMIYFFEIFFK